MPKAPPPPRTSLWPAILVLACTPAGAPTGTGPSGQVAVEGALQVSAGEGRSVVYACRQPPAASSDYSFEVDGVPVRPRFFSLTGEESLRPGDIIRLPPADMIAGPPGHYRYFTDPARPRELDLEFNGGPRHLVALRVGGPEIRLKRIGDSDDMPNVRYGKPKTIDRPLADLRQLRGLALETWNDDIAATVARLDGAQLSVQVETARSRTFATLPGLAAALPPDLRALTLDVGLGGPWLARPSGPGAAAPVALEGLPALSGLRSLELLMTNRRAADFVDAGALARYPALQRLVIDSELPLRDLQGLRALSDLRVLALDYHRDLQDLAFVRELPNLRRLDIAHTEVESLAPLAGHPQLAAVFADVAPIAALPDAPPPNLRELSVVSTRLSDAAVAAFTAEAPQARVHHRWDQRLADAAACATRIHVRTGGTCHRDPARERTLFTADDPAAVGELLPLLRVDEDRSDTFCMCCGTLTIELYRESEPMAEVTLHHGRKLRYSKWPADGQISDPSALCAWLERRGVREACDE